MFQIECIMHTYVHIIFVCCRCLTTSLTCKLYEPYFFSAFQQNCAIRQVNMCEYIYLFNVVTWHLPFLICVTRSLFRRIETDMRYYYARNGKMRNFEEKQNDIAGAFIQKRITDDISVQIMLGRSGNFYFSLYSICSACSKLAGSFLSALHVSPQSYQIKFSAKI